MERVTLRVPGPQLDSVESLVDAGQFPSRSEAIRAAIRALVDGRVEAPEAQAVTDGGATACDGQQEPRATPDRMPVRQLSDRALEGRYLKGAFERAGHYEAVDGQIVEVRDGDGGKFRRTLVLDDGTVVPVAGLLGYDLSATRGEADV